MFGFGGMGELMFIFFLAMLIFGPEKLPEIGRMVAKGMAEVRKASNELKRTLNAELAVSEQESESRRRAAALTAPVAAPLAELAAPVSLDTLGTTAADLAVPRSEPVLPAAAATSADEVPAAGAIPAAGNIAAGDIPAAGEIPAVGDMSAAGDIPAAGDAPAVGHPTATAAGWSVATGAATPASEAAERHPGAAEQAVPPAQPVAPAPPAAQPPLAPYGQGLGSHGDSGDADAS
jgi:Sec-independent protein translocase protein TatA